MYTSRPTHDLVDKIAANLSCAMSGCDPNELLLQIAAQGQALKAHQPGAREALIDLSYALANSLQKPSETIQRIGIVEVRWPAIAALLCVPSRGPWIA